MHFIGVLCPICMCRAVCYWWFALRCFGLCRASFWCSIWSVLVFHCSVESNLPLWLSDNACSQTWVSGYLYLFCFTGVHPLYECFRPFVQWCWSLLPMISRLACPVSWANLIMGSVRLCIFDIRNIYGKACVFHGGSRSTWYLPEMPAAVSLGLADTRTDRRIRRVLCLGLGSLGVVSWPTRQSYCCAWNMWTIWLILPVVICLSQRLSHACLSTDLHTVKPRMAH